MKYNVLNKRKLANWAKRQGYIMNYGYSYDAGYRSVDERYILCYTLEDLTRIEQKEKELNTIKLKEFLV